MRGFLCDRPGCGIFVPDRVMPRLVMRYTGTRDDNGRPIEQEAHFCDPCADLVAGTFGLDLPVSDDDTDLITFDQGETE